MVWTVVWLLCFARSPGRLAAQDQPGAPTGSAVSDTPPVVPDLADLIPREATLPGRFATLKQKMGRLADLTDMAERLAAIDVALQTHTSQFQRLRAAPGAGYYRLTALKAAIRREQATLATVSTELTETLRQLGDWRATWLAAQDQWTTWQSSRRYEAFRDAVQQPFAMAHRTINAALELLQHQFTPFLAAQQRARDLQVRLDVLATDVAGVLAALGDDAVRQVTPPMLSSRYRAQFDRRLWHDVRLGLEDVAWPDRPFMAQYGWVMLLQGVLSLGVMLVIVRHRRQLAHAEDWRFLATRPGAAGCFVGVMLVFAFYEWSFLIFDAAYNILFGLAFARLLGGLLQTGWHKQVVYASVTLMSTTRLLEALNVPHPLLRLYVLLAALVGLVCFLRWAAHSRRDGDTWLYPWALRGVAGLFGCILLAELAGQDQLAEYLLVSSLRSLLSVLAFGLVRYLVHTGLEGAIQRTLSRRVALLHSDTPMVGQRLTQLADALIGVVVLAVLLAIWGLYDNPGEALRGVLALGVSVGAKRVTVGHIVAAVVAVFGALLASDLLQNLLMRGVLARRQLETGVQLSIARLVHYALVFVGGVVALVTLGVELTHLTILLSALGVGIGFGLQGIVNNVLCGLIVLFERPIRVGDIIELGGKWAQIQKIGLRATTVQTFDRSDIILPNSDLINQQVTNWTLENRQARLIIPVGVAYGSDVPCVMRILAACAADNPSVMHTPEPQVLFRHFGDSALEFELRAWVWNFDDWFRVESDLRQEIDRRFRDAGIVIAFPQRDLHIRSVDTPSASRSPLPLWPDA